VVTHSDTRPPVRLVRAIGTPPPDYEAGDLTRGVEDRYRPQTS